MNLNECKAYELLDQQDLEGIKSKGYILRHKKSGARISIVENDDDNKVFYIGFRTPSQNSTGVAHILEHSVLCGSKSFPAKDPFVELAKGSLNTFLNAMTYPDKTIYPVASCNEKDLKNLMHVYLDAVFYPNIYTKEEIFKQEGWHYEMEDAGSPITLNGVVYNEMKGAFSSPDEVLNREILNSLFPDTTYQYESGGDPAFIPDLSYEEFLEFHKKYYHPSNSYIYLYGNMDMEERLNWMDEHYLSTFDTLNVDSEIKLQKPFEKPIEVELPYSISSTEPLDDNTYLSYNMAVGSILDETKYIAFDILDYALLSAPGAPLKKALLDAKIGKDIMSSYDNSTLQPIFSIIVKNSNVERKEEFIGIIKKILTEQVRDGINRKSLLAAINSFEFKYREADFGRYPKGLLYGIQCLDSWLYDERKPYTHLNSLKVIEHLKGQLDTNYFEELIEQYLLNNNHVSVVTVKPQRGLNAEIEKELEDKLKKYKDSLSKEEIERIAEQTRHLREYQEEPSTKEELEAIPLLSREDLNKESKPFQNEEMTVDDTLMLYHEIESNGIAYINMLFDISKVQEEDIPYLGIMKAVLGYVNTTNYTYNELANEINLYTGGIFSVISTYAHTHDSDYKVKYEIKTKVLYHQIPKAMELMDEIISGSSLEDTNRLYEIIAQLKSRIQMVLSSSGHAISTMRAISYFSPTARYSDMTSGIDFYRVVAKIEENFEGEVEGLVNRLKRMIKEIFSVENLMISLGAEKEALSPLKENVPKFKKSLSVELSAKEKCVPNCTKEKEGFMDASKVQYVARAGNFKNAGYEYTGELKILKVILSYDYLWLNVRVKGGAYGCMSGFARNGDSYFASYRDPNLEKTNEIYQGIPEYLDNFTIDERDMTKYIIGTFSSIDAPLTPADKAGRSVNAWLTQTTLMDIQKERDQVLNADQSSIRGLSKYMKAILDENAFCVIGNEEKLTSQKDMFDKLENL